MGKDVLVFEKKKEAVCSSRDIASRFGKRHDHVLEAIDNLIPENSGVKSCFTLSKYIAENGQEYRMFTMNRDGFSLLAMGFTGKKALEWKLKYIAAFNAMEKALRERASIEWKTTRIQGKVQRKLLTDAIQVLEGIAINSGSKNGGMLYSNYTRMINKAMGIQERDESNTSQLAQIAFLEDFCSKLILGHVVKDTPYKEIYYICKAQIETMTAMTRNALAITS